VEDTARELDELINQPPANENPEQPSTQPMPVLSPSKSNKNVKFSQVQSSKSLSSKYESFSLRRGTRNGRNIDADSKDPDYKDPSEKMSSKSKIPNNSKAPSFKSGKEEIKK
jgi:hypothetical protein